MYDYTTVTNKVLQMNSGIIFPETLLEDEDINIEEKLAYATLLHLRKDRLNNSAEIISLKKDDLYRILPFKSEKTCRKILNRLDELGYINLKPVMYSRDICRIELKKSFSFYKLHKKNNKKEKEFHYIRIPKNILYNSALTSKDKIALSLIKYLSDKHGKVDVAVRVLAEYLNMSPSTLGGLIYKLNRYGLIEYCDVTGNSRALIFKDNLDEVDKMKTQILKEGSAKRTQQRKNKQTLVENVESVENVENLDKAEKIESVENVENTNRIENVENLSNSEKIEKIEKVEKIEKIESNHIINTAHLANVEKADTVENLMETTENIQNIENANIEKAENIQNIQNIEKVENLYCMDTISILKYFSLEGLAQLREKIDEAEEELKKHNID